MTECTERGVFIHKDDDSRNSVAVFVFQNGYRHIFVLLSRLYS